MRNGFYNSIITAAISALLLTAGGCMDKQAAKQIDEQNSESLKQKQLENDNEKLVAENSRLKKEIASLSSLDESLKYKAMTRLSGITLTGRCGIYNTDKDNAKDTLRVYLKTIDDVGDTIKATGSTEVELWNLNAKPSEAMVGKWQANAETLKTSWSGTFMTNYFKLEFPLGQIKTDEGEFTLKVKFYDHLTGKTFTTQRVVK